MPVHLNANGQFQSDKYPTCPADKVPLSVNDETAQDLLWEYANRRRSVDEEFADDLQARLWVVGYRPPRKPYASLPQREANALLRNGLRPPYHKGAWRPQR